MIFQVNAITTFLVLASIAFVADAKRNKKPKVDRSIPCFDYSDAFDELEQNECTERKLFKRIQKAFDEQRKLTNERCKGGINRDLMAITKTTTVDEAREYLQGICDDALEAAIDAANSKKHSWTSLEDEPALIDLEQFFDGQGHLNNETGNFQQEENDFIKKGGYNKFNYIGEDPRLNDHYPTSDASFISGEAIYEFYQNEASSGYLHPPTFNFESGCPLTQAAVCCWHRDRQYFDNNGNCGFADCANQNPSDNTDLCWMETDDGPFPYPGDKKEQDLHCHGFAWSDLDETDGHVNTNAKWNNLFFVSLYDHLYMRGYVNSITDDPNIVGQQAMCGCVEDTSMAVARADCTSAVAKTNYTAGLDNEGLIYVNYVEDTFSIKYIACEGYEYDSSITPSQYEHDYNFNGKEAGLTNSNNDLSAFMFRQYLEGLVSIEAVEEFAKTVVGYYNASVNDGDKERNVVCEEKFVEKFDQVFVEREVEKVE